LYAQIKKQQGWAWWYIPVIPVLGKLRQDCKFETMFVYIAKPCPIKRKKKRKERKS
jgi:hypothetical protein